MGKDYTPIKLNNLNLKKAYSLLLKKRVIEASSLQLFNIKSIGSIPFYQIKEIEIGTEGTKETIVRIKENDFIVLNGTIELEHLRDV